MQSMQRGHGGAIVNIVADMWGGMPGMGHSGAARAGMVNFTETAALEWAPACASTRSRRAGSPRAAWTTTRPRWRATDPRPCRPRAAAPPRHRERGLRRRSSSCLSPAARLHQRRVPARRRRGAERASAVWPEVGARRHDARPSTASTSPPRRACCSDAEDA